MSFSTAVDPPALKMKEQSVGESEKLDEDQLKVNTSKESDNIGYMGCGGPDDRTARSPPTATAESHTGSEPHDDDTVTISRTTTRPPTSSSSSSTTLVGFSAATPPLKMIPLSPPSAMIKIGSQSEFPLMESVFLRDDEKAGDKSIHQATGSYNGREHENVAKSLYSIGNVLDDKGEKDEGLSMFMEALSIQDEVFGKGSKEITDARTKTATLLTEKGELDEALEINELNLGVQKKVLGIEHPDTATIMGNIGVALHEAMEMFEAELLIKGKLHENDELVYETMSL